MVLSGQSQDYARLDVQGLYYNDMYLYNLSSFFLQTSEHVYPAGNEVWKVDKKTGKILQTYNPRDGQLIRTYYLIIHGTF